MRLLVFPVDVVLRCPFVGCLIECELDVVRPVAVVLKCPGVAAIVVHDIDSDLVLVREAGVIRPCLVDL